jgi:hypothetical protein
VAEAISLLRRAGGNLMRGNLRKRQASVTLSPSLTLSFEEECFLSFENL